MKTNEQRPANVNDESRCLPVIERAIALLRESLITPQGPGSDAVLLAKRILEDEIRRIKRLPF
jgi:hypothetical protein